MIEESFCTTWRAVSTNTQTKTKIKKAVSNIFSIRELLRCRIKQSFFKKTPCEGNLFIFHIHIFKLLFTSEIVKE